ncbi:MAG: hypothetical protein PHX43_08505 [Alphaproteobacteria bacterium]|nr:hypothetical protein [Alphaproteobacteria bacterium]
MYPSSIPANISDAYAKTKPQSWIDVADFASKEFEKEAECEINPSNGAFKFYDPSEYIGAPVDAFDADKREIMDGLFAIRTGALFMDFVGHCFENESRFPVSHLIKSAAVGTAMLGTLLDFGMWCGSVGGGDPKLYGFTSHLKELVSEANASNLIDFFKLGVPMSPDTRKSMESFLIDSFGASLSGVGREVKIGLGLN